MAGREITPRQRASLSIEKQLAAESRSDINVFFPFVLGSDHNQSDCHKKLQAHMDTHDRAGIIAQKELGKTTQAIMRAIHRLGNNSNLLQKLLCANDELAVDRVMMIRDLISRNRRLKMVFPNLIRHPGFDDWGKLSLTVKRDRFSKDSSIEACGILTSGTGGRAEEILFDDVVDFQNAIKYPKQRDQVKKAFKNVWIPLLGPKGKAIYLATLHHEADLTSELLNNPEWNWINLSVTGDPPVSHWPEKWTAEALRKRYAEIGSIEFDRTMRNILHPEGEQIIKQPWIRRFSTDPERSLRLCSWDFAASGGEGDWTARAVLDININERIIRILRTDRWRGLTYNEMIALILEDFDEFVPDHLLVEAAGFQVIMGRDERLMDKPVEQIVPKLNKEQRVRQTAVWYERGRVLFKDGMTDRAIEELTGFPRMEHDDVCDAVTQGVLFGTEKMGAPFRPEDVISSGMRIFTGGQRDEEDTKSESYRLAGRSKYRSRVGFGRMKW